MSEEAVSSAQEPVKQRKVYPARMFNRATIVCPSCLKLFKEAEQKCPRCGFDAYLAVKRFPFTPPVMTRFMDNAGILDQADGDLAGDLNAAIDALVRKFPQLGFYVCTLELDDPVSLSEFGFWMMNACRLQEGQRETDRAWSILLLMDVKRGLLSLTPGYAIEAFMDDSAWQNALQTMGRKLSAGDYRSALLGFVKEAEQLMWSSARNVRMKINGK